MKTSLRHIIIEFTLSIYNDNEIVLGNRDNVEEIIISKEISAFGFLFGHSTNFLTNQVIFYN
ncbi:MAG: hypothetical protein OQJ81_01195 [Melioribacteraceae bacterium]|nr:hypothetical protein [Melioribacteraceae bacterium]